MNRIKLTMLFLLSLLGIVSCSKDKNDDGECAYYEVGFQYNAADWRDTAFVVRTRNSSLMQQTEAELALPVAQRKIVFGTLASGNGGYNRNAAHNFNWHFKDNNWSLVDLTAEIYDGRPYSDVHQNTAYWMDTMKRYGSWGSYIRQKLPGKPQ